MYFGFPVGGFILEGWAGSNEMGLAMVLVRGVGLEKTNGSVFWS